MSSPTDVPTEVRYSAQLNYGLQSFPTATHSQLAPTSESEHAATTQMISALMQSVYDLAGELRGLGPVTHRLFREQGERPLNRRLEELLAMVGDLQSTLEAVRDPHVYKQLQALGIDNHSRDLRLHIGCGGHHLPSWINIDNHPAPLAINLEWGLPLPSGSAGYVFLSHLLEHLFYPTQSDRLLAEIRRVLQPGGIVRIVVPDIEQCIDAYANKDHAFFADRRKYWTWLPKDMTHLESFLAYAGVGPTPVHLFEHHKFGYDFETLKRCLERTGFVNIRRCGYQQSSHEALRVDHASSNASAMHGERHYSLFVEAEAL